jgi:hypothetical protein
MSSRASLLVAVGIAVTGACGGAPPVDLSPAWPEAAPSLEEATRAWTRQDSLVGDFSESKELIAQLTATFKSPQWRTALVQRMRERGDFSPAEAEARLAAEKNEAAEHHVFFFLLTTHDRRLNDLTRGERSVWSVRLRDASGAEVEPIEIKKDRRPRSAIEAELPHLGDFDEVYIARFPASHPILAEGAGQFSVKMWGGRGALELVWRAE